MNVGTKPTSNEACIELARRCFGTRLREVRAVWPGIEISDEAFFDDLAPKLSTLDASSLSTSRLAELLLASACARHDRTALAYFEARYMGEVDIVARRFPTLPTPLDEVKQRMRERLFVGPAPSIVGYAGSGDLRAWMRAASLRLLLNITTRERRETPTDERFFDALADSDPSCEAAYVKRACRAEFEQAFAAALATLSARQRSLLRYAYADGLGIDRVGVIYRVHRATAARWIERARSDLVLQTRKELAARLRISLDEADSVVRGALSMIGVSLLEERSIGPA